MKPNPHNEIIGRRAIVSRLTGETVTKFSPVYAQDYPYELPPPNQSIQRYIDYDKFEDLACTKQIYFRRADQLEKLEGTISKRGIDGTSASDRAWAKMVSVDKDTYENRLAYRNIAKQATFINCWHINTKENRAMWDAYTKSTESVMIISTCGRLVNSLTRKVMFSKVKYISEDTPRTEFDERSLFFYKDKKSFGYEQEFRLLIDLIDMEDAPSILTSDGFGARVFVDLGAMVYAVNPHPDSTDYFRNKVLSLLRCCLGWP